MQAIVTKTFRFEAAHRLLNHDGKCRQPHGHSYRVAVSVRGPISTEEGHPKEGMVIDFADIKTVWEEHLKPVLDHRDLNETLPVVTTAENIAVWIARAFGEHGIPIREVIVWETATSSAKVTYHDLNGGA